MRIPLVHDLAPKIMRSIMFALADDMEIQGIWGGSTGKERTAALRSHRNGQLLVR